MRDARCVISRIPYPAIPISHPATRIPYLVSRSVQPGIVSEETAESLEDHVDSESSDVGVIGGDSAHPWLDILNIGSDREPRRHLEVVKCFHTGAVVRVEYGAGDDAELGAGANIVPADPPSDVATGSQETVAAETLRVAVRLPIRRLLLCRTWLSSHT